MRMSDHEGTIDAGSEGTPLKIAHPVRHQGDMGHKRARRLWPGHPKIIADEAGGEALVVIIDNFLPEGLHCRPGLRQLNGKPG